MVRHTLSLASMGATIQDIESKDTAVLMETPPVAEKVAKKEKKKKIKKEVSLQLKRKSCYFVVTIAVKESPQGWCREREREESEQCLDE